MPGPDPGMGFLPLRQLFRETRAPGSPVALHLDGSDRPAVRTWAEFAAAAAWAADRARRGGGRRWVLACPEAWDFAAGLFGLLQAGRTVVLPPNFLPETLRGLEREADGVLWEAGSAPPGPPAVLEGSLEFWTSGSTGEPKGVPRSLAQLDAEVAMLELTFGHLMPSGPMVGTVPHHHIYGCLFRILWPLAAGRPFLCEPAGDPAAFLRALAQPAPVALVVSPAHLSRLPRLMDLDSLPLAPAVVFSSGGPLNAADAALWRERVPAGVVEIYGSTETGGIAWRNQGADPASATGPRSMTWRWRTGPAPWRSPRSGPGRRRCAWRMRPSRSRAEAFACWGGWTGSSSWKRSGSPCRSWKRPWRRTHGWPGPPWCCWREAGRPWAPWWCSGPARRPNARSWCAP